MEPKPYQGMNWIWGPTRYAIYFRDRDPIRGGFRCLWCGRGVGTWNYPRLGGARRRAALDHVIPRSAGGGDGPDNLVTACIPCNNARRNSHIDDWAESCNFDPIVYERIRTAIGTPLTEFDRWMGRGLWWKRRRGRRTWDSYRGHWSSDFG